MLRTKLFDDDRVRDAGVEVEPVGDLVDDDVVRDLQVVHRPVEPQADLGVLDVEAVDGRVAQRAADAVDLVGVDALAHVALDGEAGQVHVAAAAVGGVLAVEADAGVHRAVRGRRRQRDLLALDDRVPVAGALDRHVVDDDVPVHLVGARRDVDLAGASSCANAMALSNASAESCLPVGSAPNSSTFAAMSRTCGRPTSSESSRSMTVHAALRPGGRREPDLVAGLVRLAEQQALLVVEVHRPERRGDRRRRASSRAGTHPHSVIHQSGCSRPAFGSLRERVLVVEPGVLRGQRHRPLAGAVDRDVERRGDAAAGRRVRDAVAHGDRVRGLRQRELDVLPGRQLHRRAARRLGGQRVRRAVGADDRAVGDRVLRLLLEEADAPRRARDQGRVEGGAGDRGRRGAGGRPWACAALPVPTTTAAASTTARAACRSTA